MPDVFYTVDVGMRAMYRFRYPVRVINADLGYIALEASKDYYANHRMETHPTEFDLSIHLAEDAPALATFHITVKTKVQRSFSSQRVSREYAEVANAC